MIEANLIEQLAKKDRVIELQRQEIALWEKLVASYKNSEAKLQAVCDSQQALLTHMQKMDILKDNAIAYIKASFPTMRLW